MHMHTHRVDMRLRRGTNLADDIGVLGRTLKGAEGLLRAPRYPGVDVQLLERSALLGVGLNKLTQEASTI